MGPLIASGLFGSVLTAFIAAHCLADLVLQTARMSRNKHQGNWLALHALHVTLLTVLFAVPFLSKRTVISVLVIGISHLLIDRLKTALSDRVRPALLLFTADQIAHLVILVVLARWLTRAAGEMTYLPIFSPYLSALTMAWALVAAYSINWNGGSALVGQILKSFQLPRAASDLPAPDRTATDLRMGRAIGILERMMVLTLVLVDQWAALGLVLAAKSIARFRELEDRRFSEYYLIGTLTSLLVAITTGLAVKFLLFPN